MDFALMIPREEYPEEERAADDPQPHSHFCRTCGTEWLCWEHPGDDSEAEGCPACDELPYFLQHEQQGGYVMHVENPYLTQLLADINGVLCAQAQPPLRLDQRILTTYHHYSVVEESPHGRTLCQRLTTRECGDWLRGFLAGRRYAGDAVQAEAYY